MSPQETHFNDASESTPLLHRENEDVALLKTDGIPTREMFWEELRTLPRYVWPVLGAQWLEYSMIAVNIISIGHLSTTALAAISLGTMTANVTGISVLYGLSSGLDTLLPAAFTSPHPQLVGLWSQRMAVIMACALVPICIVWYNAEAIFIALDQDPEVSRLSTVYLRWLSLGLPALSFNIISRRYFQSQRLFYVQTTIILYVAPITVFANYLLVWGPEPIRLGFIGAPVATITSYYLISIASFIYGRYFIPQTAWHPLSSKMFCDLGLLTELGLSGVAQTTSSWWAWECVALATSYLGPTALACQSILLSTSSATFQIFFSSAQAATIRVGNLLGEKNAIRARVASKAGLVGVFLATIITSLTLYLARNSWPKLYTDDPAVISLVSSTIPVIALYQIPNGLAQVGAAYMRVRGLQAVGALINLSGFFVFGVPLGMWLAFRCGAGIAGLWIGLTVGLAINSITLILFWSRIDWKHEVEKATERNSREEHRQKTLKLADAEV